MGLLNQVVWTFTDIEYKSIDDFNTKVIQYQKLILKEKAAWKPEEIVITRPLVDISYTVWIDRDSLAENETLLENDDFFEDEENSEDGLFQAEVEARFSADNGRNFTSLELLYKLHQQMTTKELGDHVFFEGLDEAENLPGIPRFYLNCGS